MDLFLYNWSQSSNTAILCGDTQIVGGKAPDDFLVPNLRLITPRGSGIRVVVEKKSDMDIEKFLKVRFSRGEKMMLTVAKRRR